MAIRNDFAPGEVLAAADLNDTFGSKVDYPSGGADGDALIKSGTFAAWGAVGGLTLITSESFSAVSSVSINGCFTSTYANYRLMIYADYSANTSLDMRLRSSGSDNSNSTYSSYVGRGAYDNSGVSALTGNAANRFQVETSSAGTEPSVLACDLFSPQAAANTYLLTIGAGETRAGSGGGKFAASTSFDGFSIFPASGTITGTIRVYGYRNS
jgi:hypothetical protein